MTPILLPFGAIMSGIASLLIAHFRAIAEPSRRRAWNVAFVAAAVMLSTVMSGLVVTLPKVDAPKPIVDEVENVYSKTLTKVTSQWLAKQNQQH